MTNHIKQFICLLFILMVFIEPAFCDEGITWGRYRLTADVSITEAYTDNLFLAETETEEDYITRVSPEFVFDVAIETDHYLSFIYKGDFDYYAEFDNFRKDQHAGEIEWSLNRPVGHRFKSGIKGISTSIQPFSAQDRQKDYSTWEAYLDLRYKVGNFSETGFKYDFTTRSFDDSRDEIDDFDRHDFSLNFLYGYLSQFPLLLEYRLTLQDNKDVEEMSTDFISHSILVGARWEPGARLSGALRIGYIRADFDEAEDYDGVTADTDLTYKLSDITTFKLAFFSALQNITITNRENGDYYISAGGRLTTNFQYWEPMMITAFVAYTNNDYDGVDRRDKLFQAGLRARYRLKDRLSFLLGYRYRKNDSDLKSVNYTENRIEAGFRISI